MLSMFSYPGCQIGQYPSGSSGWGTSGTGGLVELEPGQFPHPSNNVLEYDITFGTPMSKIFQDNRDVTGHEPRLL
jgi:hypothetical protein